jgi:uncharacterized protein (TIGR02284 family)
VTNPSKDLVETESTLRLVIETLIDGQDALRNIGDELKDESLKRKFLEESLTRAEFRGELENLLHQEGVHDVNEHGTTAGTVHRAWAELKAKLGGSDHTLLVTAEEIEDAANEEYGKAMQAEPALPLPIRQLLARQAAHINEFHDAIKAARERLSEAA